MWFIAAVERETVHIFRSLLRCKFLEMEAEEETDPNKKRRLDLDFKKLLSSKDADDEARTELVVVPAAGASMVDTSDQLGERRRRREEQTECAGDDVAGMPDHALAETIQRNEKLVNASFKLPDGGDKLKTRLHRLKEEQKRREQRLPAQDLNEHSKRASSDSSSQGGALREAGVAASRSQFATIFEQKIEHDDSRICNSFAEELSFFGHCDKKKKKQTVQSRPKGREKSGLSWKGRVTPESFYKQTSLNNQDPPCNKHRHLSLNRIQISRQNLSDAHLQRREKLPCPAAKREVCEALLSDGSMTKEENTVVLVDEDELEPVETTETVEEVLPCDKETKIYYPSREDPESVEIHYDDIQCLKPQTYLTSPIMNFYIRYLQKSSPACDSYHFFNTYFYKKLQEAVAVEMSEKEIAFKKFRRWWKGVSIFQKAYILLPIHEDLHWSLAIICIPDKADESGPIILHLDSLGYHSSRSIFDNVKRFLMKEKSYYLSEDADALHNPILDRIWENLLDKIDEKIIKVPQQKNDYDCGLFVLFFMERFIEEAPERLKRQNLAMFGKRWFKPEEASSLRRKIREILVKKFKESMGDKNMWAPVCMSSNGDSAKRTYQLRTP